MEIETADGHWEVEAETEWEANYNIGRGLGTFYEDDAYEEDNEDYDDYPDDYDWL